MNSYFRLIIGTNGVDIKIFRATDGGKNLGIQEVTSYLARNRIRFDLKALNEALTTGTEDVVLHLMDNEILPVSESSFVKVSNDRMHAVIRFYPASEGDAGRGKSYGKEDIYSDLRIEKVIYGINENNVASYLQNKCYCTDYDIAEGVPVREGRDAELRYYFETSNKIRPTLLEDGSVDFFNLNVLNLCKKGDVLAELIPEDRGEEGKDVYGTALRPHDVKKKKFSYGLNISLSEDELKLISDVNGHVSLVDGKVFVNNILEVKNVDNSTGNIVYEGNVIIDGNVCNNFSVISHGDVEVKGVVEGASIEADGNIIISRGMNGMGKGSLKAGGNVISKFLENCNVLAAGYVETDSIMHSVVQAGTEVNVSSHKGFITGSTVSATNVIRVKTLGTTMGTDTAVSVGVDPSVVNRFNELRTQTLDAQKNLKLSMPVLEATTKKLQSGAKLLPEQVKSLQTLAMNVKQWQELIKTNTAEMEALKEQMALSTDARIEVNGEVFPGTKITISGVTMMVRDAMGYCSFQKKDGEIVNYSL